MVSPSTDPITPLSTAQGSEYNASDTDCVREGLSDVNKADTSRRANKFTRAMHPIALTADGKGQGCRRKSTLGDAIGLMLKFAPSLQRQRWSRLAIPSEPTNC